MEKNYYYSAELIEPVDKPITKTLAVKLYAQVLAKERPHLDQAVRTEMVCGFRESIDIYRLKLDYVSQTVRIEDLKNNIIQLREEIEELDEALDGLKADDIDYSDFEHRNDLKAKLKDKQQELKQLKAVEKKLNNKDLRFFLAAELMYLTHGKEVPEAIEIAQQTQDYWDAIRAKKQLPPLATASSPIHSEKTISGVQMNTNPNMADLLQEAADPNRRDANIWAQCFVEADGDDGKAQALYVKRKLPQPAPPEHGFCPNCGARCKMTDTFCDSCRMHMTGDHKPVAQKPKAYEPQQPTGHSINSVSVVKTAKSRGIYIILGLFFGMFGIHNFYAGHYTRGVFQLLCTAILGWFVIGLVITAIWVIIDLIYMKEDGAGDPMV